MTNYVKNNIFSIVDNYMLSIQLISLILIFSGSAASASGSGTNQLINTAGKMYSLVISSSNSKKSSEDIDRCKNIAKGTEIIASANQQISQNKMKKSTNSVKKTQQKELVHQAAKSHNDRADNSKIQGYGWGATSGCYIKKAVIDKKPSTFLKIAATTFMAGFYLKQKNENENRYSTVKKIADQLGDSSKCNPITENTCYCSQPENKNDSTYCIPDELHDEELDGDEIRSSCLDENLNADPKCTCRANNSCYDKTFASKLGTASFGQSDANSLRSTMKNLSNGTVSASAPISGGSLKSVAAASKEILKKNDSKFKSSKITLTAKQRKEAKVLGDFGIPPNMARSLAARPIDQAAQKAINKFKKGTVSKIGPLKKKGKAGSNVIYFGGKGLMGKRKRAKSEGVMKFNFGLKKKKASKAKGDVLTFKEGPESKYFKEAQINKNDQGSIFKSISRRYLIHSKKLIGR